MEQAIVGHKEPRRHKQYKTMYIPNGCRYHSDCFTCPFPDCILSDKEAAVVKRCNNGFAFGKSQLKENLWQLK